MLCRVSELPRIPGFVDAHCHAFQRALRGRSEGGDFWAWRETMLELMNGPGPENGTWGFTYSHPMFWAPFSLVGEGAGQ